MKNSLNRLKNRATLKKMIISFLRFKWIENDYYLRFNTKQYFNTKRLILNNIIALTLNKKYYGIRNNKFN